MKNIFNLILVIFASLFILSCRNSDDVPEDIHEHEEIEKITLTVTEKSNAANVQTVNYIGGNADKALTLQNGKSYLVSVDFFHKHDDHYHSMLDEIVKEKDEHFIVFEFAGIGANLVRAGDDIVRTDGKKLGVKTEWSITSAPSNAKVSLKLFHTPTSVDQNYPSATNQLGKVTGGEADVNALISIQ